MTWQLPWVTSGVTEISLAMSRTLAFAATNGRAGIVTSTDLKVTANATPNASVNIASGTFVAPNRFVSGSNQSYVGTNVGAVSLSIPATSSAARSDLIYAHVIDSGQPGQPATTTPVETRVITGVPNTTRRIEDVPALATQTGYVIARIDRIANATTVAQANIIDLREMAYNTVQPETRLVYSSAGSEITRASATFVTFPADAQIQMNVPTWANRINVTGRCMNLTLTGASDNTDTLFAAVQRIRFSTTAPGVGGGTTLYSDSFTMNANVPTGAFLGNFENYAYGEITIPQAMRGITVWLSFEAAQGANSKIGLKARAGTLNEFQAVFRNVPE